MFLLSILGGFVVVAVLDHFSSKNDDENGR